MGPRTAVAAVFFLNGASFSSWYSRLPAIQDRLGLGPGAVGLALLGAPLGLLIAQPAVGTVEDAAATYVEENGLAEGLSGGSGNIVIGAAGFTENLILGQMYAQVLTAAGFTASVTQVDNRELYYPELIAGNIQVVPEYVGTLANFINGQVNGPDANESDPPASGDLDATVANDNAC